MIIELEPVHLLVLCGPVRAESHSVEPLDVLVDEIDIENEEAIARTPWDAPEIDGNGFLPGETDLKPGDMVRVKIVEAEEYDLIGERV